MRYLHQEVRDPIVDELKLFIESSVVWHACNVVGDTIERLPGSAGTVWVSPFAPSDLPSHIVEFLLRLIYEGADSLGVSVDRFTLEGLRYETGVGLAIHNDHEPEHASGPVARLVVCFRNPALEGGEFEFFAGQEDGTFLPFLTSDNQRDSVFGFVIGPDSYHAVQPVAHGTRYSFVISLFSS